MIKHSQNKVPLRSYSKNSVENPAEYIRFRKLDEIKGRASLGSKESNNSLELTLKKEELHLEPLAIRKPKRKGVYCKTVGFEGHTELGEYVKQIRAVRHNLKRNSLGR